MPGARSHPQPRVRNKKAHERNHHRFARTTRHSLRDGLSAYSALSPVTGLFCHRRSRENCFPRKLDTSVGVSGPHDFAVRARLRQRLRRGLRQSAEALAKAEAARTSLAPPASIASRPALMTCATPLFRNGMARVVDLICPTGKAKYFCEKDWTRICAVRPSGKSVWSRRRGNGTIATATSLLPLWEKVARTQSVPDEGSVSTDRDPSSAFASRRHLLPQGEKEESAMDAALLAPSRTLWNVGSSAGACHRAAHRADPVADDDGGEIIPPAHHSPIKPFPG